MLACLNHELQDRSPASLFLVSASSLGAESGRQIADETYFAKAERRKWAVSERNIPLRDTDVRWAIRLVQLTMAYHLRKADLAGRSTPSKLRAKGFDGLNANQNAILSCGTGKFHPWTI
jgi:hypothetical protein